MSERPDPWSWEADRIGGNLRAIADSDKPLTYMERQSVLTAGNVLHHYAGILDELMAAGIINATGDLVGAVSTQNGSVQ